MLDLTFGAVLPALVYQESTLRGGERLSQHALQLSPARLLWPPLGVEEGILCLDVAQGSVDGGSAEPRPGPVEPPEAERGVPALAEPDGALTAAVRPPNGLGGRGALAAAVRPMGLEAGVLSPLQSTEDGEW
jgi:hypothetical protein